MRFKQTILLIVILIISTNISQAESFGINLYGLSFHSGVEGYNYDRLNEVNKGIGVRADFGKKDGDAIFMEAGKYNDSFENEAKYVSVGYQYRIWKQLRFGINAAFYNTKSTNNGETFFAPIPIMSYRVWRVTVNTVYLPKYQRINPFTIVGAYLTFTIIQGK